MDDLVTRLRDRMAVGIGLVPDALCHEAADTIAAQAEEIERLRKLVADERESCAKVCDDLYGKTKMYNCTPEYWVSQCATKIRARSAP